MGKVEGRLADQGLVLPPPLAVAATARLPFPMVRRLGSRLMISGHGPQLVTGELSPVCGKVGAQVSLEEAYAAARLVALSMLGSIKRELGELDRVIRWTRVFGMVNAAPGFNNLPAVINGFSDLILTLYGEERGLHVRSAVGMASLPFDIPVEVEAEVEVEVWPGERA